MQVITIIKEITANKIIADKGKEVKRQMIAISKPPPNINFPPNKCVFLQFSSLFNVHGKRMPAK